VGGRERYLFIFYIGSVNAGIMPFTLTSRNYLYFFDVFLPGYCQLNKEYVLEPTIIKIKGIAREII
jgi:hypothetical protein